MGKLLSSARNCTISFWRDSNCAIFKATRRPKENPASDEPDFGGQKSGLEQHWLNDIDFVTPKR